MAECSTMKWGDFKPRLADALVNHLQPIQVKREGGHTREWFHLVTYLCLPGLGTVQAKYHELMSDVSYIDSVLLEGSSAANEVAETTLDACKDAMGFVLPKKR